MKVAVVGGGAAGFFSALAAKAAAPDAEVVLFERSAKLLSKVRISGGGRCNVTHHCFDPKQLVRHYPRGSKELLGPFHRFGPQDTIDWFESRGVKLKTEADGRMFPTTDSSETIIDCLMQEADHIGVRIHTRCKLQRIERTDAGFHLHMGQPDPFVADRLILATGSAPAGWEWAAEFGHSVVAPVPSLFTFNIPGFELEQLSGVSVQDAKVSLEDTAYSQQGPLLITHWGFSGPAALKLSAFAARYLAENAYTTRLKIDWVPGFSDQAMLDQLQAERRQHPRQQVSGMRWHGLPKKLWQRQLQRCGIDERLPINQLSKTGARDLIAILKNDGYQVSGKTTNKEEFVTCGGVALHEVDMRTMESRLCPGLYFCGEIMDVDGVTGGFNFQNAWTTGWLAGNAAVEDE